MNGLQLQTGNSVKLSWKKVKGAVRYNIYAAKCGKNYKLTHVATVKGSSKLIKRISGKKFKKGTQNQSRQQGNLLCMRLCSERRL